MSTEDSSEKLTQNLRAVSDVSSFVASVPFVHLVVEVHGTVNEYSMFTVLDEIRREISEHGLRLILVDLREASIFLTISDLHGLGKRVLSHFLGVVDKVALVLKREDILTEKFLEPLLRNRGFPIVVTDHYEDAVDWLEARSTRPR